MFPRSGGRYLQFSGESVAAKLARADWPTAQGRTGVERDTGSSFKS